MTQTAKRRWSKELDSIVDGIAFGSNGPVLLHGYDEPAGGKWIDDVIPGKLGAYDRTSGERLWLAPCEVGYGRGFAAGTGPRGQVLVLGPSANGHLIVRMAANSGELLEASPIEAFDEADVAPDFVVCVSAGRIIAYDSETFEERWTYSRDGERYHHVARAGKRDLLVVASSQDSKGYGILRINVESGRFQGAVLPMGVPLIRAITVTGDSLIVLTSDLERALPAESTPELLSMLANHPGGGPRDTLSLLCLRARSEPGDLPLWFKVLETQSIDSVPDVSISSNSGKLYVERLAFLEALDATTGRPLGEWTVPGLDEQVDWCVVDGAGLLAEETRVSVFELPA